MKRAERPTRTSPSKAKLAGIFLLVCIIVVPAIVFFRAAVSQLSGRLGDGNSTSTEENFSGILKRFRSLFGEAGKSVSGFGSITQEIAGLAEDISFLRTHAVSIFVEGHSNELIPRLKAISAHLKKIREEGLPMHCSDLWENLDFGLESHSR